MTDRELMQQALEALEFYYDQHSEESDAKVITALRERLAQPEQAAMSFYDGNGRRFAHLPARTHWEGCEEVHPDCAKLKEKNT